MSDLFEPAPADKPDFDATRRPLAARMRPRTLEDIVGQDHILGPGKLLRRAIEADRLSSIILYGPPGCGKTSLAEVIARTTRRAFDRSSGVLSNVAGLRQSLEAAKQRRAASNREKILFIDEIHRFNKAQQDVLLPAVENRLVTLIAATTENPSFEVISALLSRSQVYVLEPLSRDDVLIVIRRGAAELKIALAADGDDFLADYANGDARQAFRFASG